MATASSLLEKVDAAIESLLDAMADEATQEYSYGGRTWKRAEFSSCLDTLFKRRDILSGQVSRQSGSSVRVGGLRRPS